jgi:hypothetical protein
MDAGTQPGSDAKPTAAAPPDSAKKYWWAAAVAVPVVVAAIGIVPSLVKKESAGVNIQSDSHNVTFQQINVIEQEYQSKTGQRLPDDVRQQIQQALQLIADKRYAEGVPLLRAASERAPVASVLTDLGHALTLSGNSSEARRAYDRASAMGAPAVSGSDSGGGTGLIGNKKPFPDGGKSFEEALPISPGLYISTRDFEGFQYYRVRLKAGQTLRITMRSPDSGVGYTSASIYNGDGALQQNGTSGGRSEVKTVEWKAPADGTFYMSIGGYATNPANAVYRVSIQ